MFSISFKIPKLNHTKTNCPSLCACRRQWVCFCPTRLSRMNPTWRGGRLLCGPLGRAVMMSSAPCWPSPLTLTSTWPTSTEAPVSSWETGGATDAPYKCGQHPQRCPSSSLFWHCNKQALLIILYTSTHTFIKDNNIQYTRPINCWQCIFVCYVSWKNLKAISEMNHRV